MTLPLKSASITNRLIGALLILELVAALALIGAVAINEHHIQSQVFDSNLRAVSSSLLGAVQEGMNENVGLDLHGLTLPRDSVFRVTDETGRTLGTSGALPDVPLKPGSFQQSKLHGRSYRFYALAGERVIDPFREGGVHHHIVVVYGLPDGHVWNEVMEAIRFSAFCTVMLLGLTALLMVWLTRRLLSPIRALASAAEEVSPLHWHFEPPQSARNFVELRPLTSAIEQTLARLQRSFDQQKRFTSDAAHELKTDLAIVKSSLQLLTMKQRSAADYEQGLMVGLDDLTRLERTVQKMLTLARLEQPAEGNAPTCRLDEAVEEVVRKSAPLASLRGVTVVVENIPSATVPLDSQDAELLCSNVLLNAIQHSREGGEVEISVGVEGERLHLSVRDNGEGIRQEDAALLFEPFYRSDPSRSRKSGGTGLGLSICKAICERVGGSITLANRSTGGAVVEIVLPLLPSAE